MTDTGMKKLPLIECFGPTLQGEGALCGQVSYFVRLGACGYRCKWCDSLHAVLPEQIKEHATYMSDAEIWEQLEGLCKHSATRDTWVTLSGGDPVMWDLYQLCKMITQGGMRTAVETQGQFYNPWLQSADLVTCSPKGPSSGMLHKLNMDVLRQYVSKLRKLVFKIVIFNEEDLVFAESITAQFPGIPLYLTAGTPPLTDQSESKEQLTEKILEQYSWLAHKVLERPKLHHATVGAQMHALIWQRAKGK